MLFAVLKHYTVAAKLSFRKALMNLDEPRGKNVRENVWAKPGSSPMERRKHINNMPGDTCSHRTNPDLAPSMTVHCELNHGGTLWVETTQTMRTKCVHGKKTHEYKTLQKKPKNVNIIRKQLKGDTHALV